MRVVLLFSRETDLSSSSGLLCTGGRERERERGRRRELVLVVREQDKERYKTHSSTSIIDSPTFLSVSHFSLNSGQIAQ